MSVSERNTCPRFVSAVRSAPAFSMMPLCVTAIVPPQSVWGWALASVGAPCVAQRVCAIAVWPSGRCPARRFSSTAILPGALCTSRPESFTTASPAES